MPLRPIFNLQVACWVVVKIFPCCRLLFLTRCYLHLEIHAYNFHWSLIRILYLPPKSLLSPNWWRFKHHVKWFWSVLTSVSVNSLKLFHLKIRQSFTKQRCSKQASGGIKIHWVLYPSVTNRSIGQTAGRGSAPGREAITVWVVMKKKHS